MNAPRCAPAVRRKLYFDMRNELFVKPFIIGRILLPSNFRSTSSGVGTLLVFKNSSVELIKGVLYSPED